MDSPLSWMRGAVFATALRLHIAGKPVPCPRPRVTKFGTTFYPKNYADWRVSAMDQLTAQHDPTKPFDGLVDVAIEAVIEAPKKTVRLAPPGDVDNLAKSVLDALTKAAVWVDDTLVNCLIVRKRWAERGEEAGFNIMIGAVSA